MAEKKDKNDIKIPGVPQWILESAMSDSVDPLTKKKRKPKWTIVEEYKTESGITAHIPIEEFHRLTMDDNGSGLNVFDCRNLCLAIVQFTRIHKESKNVSILQIYEPEIQGLNRELMEDNKDVKYLMPKNQNIWSIVTRKYCICSCRGQWVWVTKNGMCIGMGAEKVKIQTLEEWMESSAKALWNWVNYKEPKPQHTPSGKTSFIDINNTIKCLLLCKYRNQEDYEFMEVTDEVREDATLAYYTEQLEKSSKTPHNVDIFECCQIPIKDPYLSSLNMWETRGSNKMRIPNPVMYRGSKIDEIMLFVHAIGIGEKLNEEEYNEYATLHNEIIGNKT